MQATQARVAGSVLILSICGAGLTACYVRATTEPTEECRTVVRNRRDVEVCTTRCNDERCRTSCRERETWSRQHRCWVE